MKRPAHLRSLLDTATGAEDPGDRLRALATLRRELETLETELAADALRSGYSWSRIGAALGVSKQTAHRRHSHGVALLDHAAETQHLGSRVLVASEARTAVRIARREAAEMGDRAVGTEHLLLGLLQCGDAATTQVLGGLGVSIELAREAVQPTVEMPLQRATRGGLATTPAGMPAATVPSAGDRAGADPRMAPETRPSAVLSPLARQVLERALADRSWRRAESLGALDLLRALLRHDNAGAVLTLTRLGVDPRELSRAIETHGRSGAGRRSPAI